MNPTIIYVALTVALLFVSIKMYLRDREIDKLNTSLGKLMYRVCELELDSAEAALRERHD